LKIDKNKNKNMPAPGTGKKKKSKKDILKHQDQQRLINRLISQSKGKKS